MQKKKKKLKVNKHSAYLCEHKSTKNYYTFVMIKNWLKF